MGLLLDAAAAWHGLLDVSYILDVGRKNEMTRIQISFFADDFTHLAGMHYAKDVDFGIRQNEYCGQRLLPALLDKRIDDSKIEKSRNWEKISGRLNAIINLQNTLENEFKIVAFNKNKVRGKSKIEAEFAIRSEISGDTYFVFLDRESGRYFCKSAFRKSITDYTENQTPFTVLQKTKIYGKTSVLLYKRDGYFPEHTN
jgi:hypothetical protein